MRLQKNTSLALYSVLEFASDPARHISAAEIAAKYSVSSHHLAKVLAELTRTGVVKSVRGAGGGYRFTGNARRLTLMDIIQMFEEFAPPTAERGARNGLTPVDRALDAVLSEIDENTNATFGSITLATMLRLIERQQGGQVAAKVRHDREPSVAKAPASRSAIRKPSSRRKSR
jgi:Rrf2 family nitric oxide-sensitive transcriptional repressor